MKFNMVCGTWIKEDDEKVLNVLEASDKWLSVEELSEATGLPPHRINCTLSMLRQQVKMYNARKKFLNDDSNE